MECRDGVCFGVGSVEVVGVDELEERLVVKELGERMVWVLVWKLITGSLPCARVVEARESADRIGYSSPWLLDNNLGRKKGSDRLFLSRKG